MNDRELIVAIRRLDQPIEPDPVFAEGLFLHLRSGGHHRPRVRPALRVAAALLVATAAVAAVLVGARLVHQRQPLPGAFRPAGPGLDRRDWAATATLADGRVLIVGGLGQDTEPVRGEL